MTNHLYVSRQMIRSVPESIADRLGHPFVFPSEHNFVARIPMRERRKEKKKKKKKMESSMEN